MKKFFIILLALSATLFTYAETVEERATRKSEIRLLVGDMLWESLIWHNAPHANYTGFPDRDYIENNHYGWTPHLGLEYQYRWNDWLSFGAQVDYQQTVWKTQHYNNQNTLTASESQTFYNISILPTVRFTYYHHPYVNLYSSIGIGIDINGGTEKDIYGKTTACGVALDIAVLGISAGKDRWFGTIEFGGLSAMKNKATIYMLASRIVTVGVGVRF